MRLMELDPTIAVALIAGAVTIITSSIAAVVSVVSLRRVDKVGVKLDAQSVVLDAHGKQIKVVKEQNDGVIYRLSQSRDQAVAEAKVSDAAATTAQAAELAATRAGDDRVAEANRTHEQSTAAIREGAKDAVEPIAEEAVTEGARAAIAEMKLEEKK